jgi:hypothetical protein
MKMNMEIWVMKNVIDKIKKTIIEQNSIMITIGTKWSSWRTDHRRQQQEIKYTFFKLKRYGV